MNGQKPEIAEGRAKADAAGYEAFAVLDMRVGRVLEVEPSAARKPTWRLTIDFGPKIGTKVSIAGLRNYEPGALVGKLVVCAMNLGTKKMGPEVSEVLVLGVPAPNGAEGTIILTTESDVELGAKVY